MSESPPFDRISPEYHDWVAKYWDSPVSEFLQSDFRRLVRQFGVIAAVVFLIDREDFGDEIDKWQYPNLLTEIGSPRSEWGIFLRAGLTEPNTEVVILSVKWLPQIERDLDDVRPLLVSNLSNIIPEARFWAALHLSRFAPETPGLVEVLAEAVQRDWLATSRRFEADDVRGPTEAAEALVRLGDRGRAALPVMQTLFDRIPLSRSRPLLGRSTEPIYFGDWPVLLRSYAILGADPKDLLRAACTLLALFVAENRDSTIPLQILTEIAPKLRSCGDSLAPALPYLAFALCDPQTDRYTVLELIRNIGPEFFVWLAPLLTDPWELDYIEEAMSTSGEVSNTRRTNLGATPPSWSEAILRVSDSHMVIGRPVIPDKSPWRNLVGAFNDEENLLAFVFANQGEINCVEFSQTPTFRRLPIDAGNGCFAFVPGKPWLIVSHRAEFHLYEYQPGAAQPIRAWTAERADFDACRAMTTSANGRWLVSLDWNGHSRLWRIDEDGLSLIKTFQGADPLLAESVFDPSGSRLATVDRTGVLVVWDLEESGPVEVMRWPLSLFGYSCKLAFGDDFLAVATESGDAALWNIETHAPSLVRTWSTDELLGIAIESDSNRLVTVERRGTVLIAELISGELLRAMQLPEFVEWVAFSPKHFRIAVGHRNHCVGVYRL